MSMGRKTLGIDLGTTRSVVANVSEGSPEVVEIDGERVTRSVVHFEDEENAVVGSNADEKLEMAPESTIEEVKKHMGEDIKFELGEGQYTPEEISAIIIEYLVNQAEDRLGEDVDDVVITIPAYFGQERSTATSTAGEIADVNVEALLPEPSAACLAYGLENDQLGEDNEELVFVYDLGGGTFDATLVDVDYEVNFIETLHTDGDDELGGSDWTNEIVEWIVGKIEDDCGIDVSDMSKQMGRIRSEARTAKHKLSEQESATILIPFVAPEENYSLEEELTRNDFEEMTTDLLQKTQDPIDDLFERSDYSTDDVDKVLLVGGSTRMPQVSGFVEDYFNIEPSKEINPDEAVALGAAVHAEILGDDDSEVINALPGDDDGEANGMVIEEVLPKPIGVRLHDGTIDHILENDMTIPATNRKENYGTVREDQDIVKLQIYQGEGDHINDDSVEQIGEAILGENDPLPNREPNKPSLACEFKITTDKRLVASGEDLLSGKGVETTINLEIDKTDTEVDKMREELPTVN